MQEQLNASFVEYLANTQAAGGRLDYYGVQVDGVAKDGSGFDLILTIKSGERYCCAEPGCHTGLYDPESWRHLRLVFGRHGLADIPPVTIRRLRGVVEREALLTCNLAFGKPEESQGYAYESGPYHECND
jgi:hypothetical protein